MEKERPINLQQFRTKKTNKRLMVRIIVYALFLFIIGAFFLQKLSQQKPTPKPIHEIRGVKVEMS
jgi:preprotein translocase subunit SecG